MVAIALKHGNYVVASSTSRLPGGWACGAACFTGSQLTIATDLAEQTQTANAIVTHLRALVPEAILPPCQQGKTRSLLHLGFHSWTTGLKLNRRSRRKNKFLTFSQGIFPTTIHGWVAYLQFLSMLISYGGNVMFQLGEFHGRNVLKRQMFV